MAGIKGDRGFAQYFKGVLLRWLCGSVIGFGITYLLLGKESALNPSISGYCTFTIVYIGFSIFLWVVMRKKK